MNGVQIALDSYNGCKAAARLRDGILDDFLIDPPDGVTRAGSIFRGRVGRAVKGMGGAFIDLGGTTGFLRQAKGLASGSMVTVQVTGYAEGTKALPLTSRVLAKSRYVIATLGAPGVNISRAISNETERVRLRDIVADHPVPDGVGLILRTSCVEATDAEIDQDLEQTMAVAAQVFDDRSTSPELLLEGPDAHELAWRDWTDVGSAEIVQEPGAFDTLDVTERIADLARPEVSLGKGARLFVEPTRALVAIDVNTGPSMEASAGLKTNLVAARDIPRCLRLRGLGGQIVVDFAPMAKKDNRQIETVLKAAFRSDPVETTLLGWTSLGLFELRRKRERLPFIEFSQ